MTMKISDQIEYYQKVQPFQRDISNLKQFLYRRNALYRHLGIIPSFLKQRSIIEFGPGFGENAIFPLLYHPKTYILVDSNKNCLDRSSRELAQYCTSGTKLSFILSSIEAFEHDELYDLVICESVIPREPNPEDLLLKVARYVVPGGVLIITCQDPVSTFSEMLRRLIALLVVPDHASLGEKLELILPIFDSHLKTIRGMSRSSSDWLLDNLLRPWDDASFSILDAIHALSDDFDIHGTSPQILVDDRWYRTIQNQDPGFNLIAENIYRANIHNLINHRVWTPPIAVAINDELTKLCMEIFLKIQSFEQTGDQNHVHAIPILLRRVIDLAATFSEDTELALRDYLRVLEKYLQENILYPFDAFVPLFGRGQQFVSFIRRD